MVSGFGGQRPAGNRTASFEATSEAIYVCSVSALSSILSGPVPETPRDSLIPTLILSGENDPITPPEYAGLLARGLGPNARWVRFPEWDTE